MREPTLRRLLLLLPLLAVSSPTPYVFSSARCLFISRCNFLRRDFWASFSSAAEEQKESRLSERLPRSSRCLAQDIPRCPQVETAGSVVDRETTRPSSREGGPPWIAQVPLCDTRRSSPVIGLPIAAAIARSNTISSSSSGCTRQQQMRQLSSGRYNRLSPSFLGSLLLPLHPKGPSRQPHRRKQRSVNEDFEKEATSSTSAFEQRQHSGSAEEVLVYPRNSGEATDADACGADDNDKQADAFGKGSRCTLREEVLEMRLQQLLQHQLLSEVALAGRSNVGKSALLNSFFRLCSSNAGSSKLPHARSSRTPGRTQAIDFYLFSFAASTRWYQAQQRHQQQQLLAQQGAFVVADLPGYGFTKGVSPERACRISRTLEVYIQRQQVRQQQLHQVLLLIDGRRGMGPHDAALLGLLLKLEVQTTLVVTKEDKTDAQQMMDLVHCLSGYKHLLLPPDLLQARLQLLSWEHQKEGGTPSQNASSGTHPHAPVYPPLQSSLLSASTAERLLQPRQEVEQQMAKQRVPVFVVSARTGAGVKQLWQHVLKSMARFSKERFLSAASAPRRKAVNQKVRSTKTRKAVHLRIQPAELPDEFF